MDSLGIYHYLNPENKDASFMVKTMEEVYDDHKGQPDEAHRHDYYVILLIKKGKGLHRIDFKQYSIEGSEVFFVSPGQIHQLIEETRPSGYIITFSKDFILQNGINECFISDINLFRDYESCPSIKVDGETWTKLEQSVDNMLSCLKTDSKFKLEAVSAHLKLFLITCNDANPLTEEMHAQSYQSSTELLRKFKLLVESHFKTEHQVSSYSSKLAITPDYLNKVIKSVIGITAKDYISSRLMTEAKRELIYSSRSSKEIAYDLGFSDPAYFSNFFKKMTGQSLTDYRSEYKK